MDYSLSNSCSNINDYIWIGGFKIMSRRLYSDSRNNGFGIGIFYLIVVCFPIISWLCGALQWMIQHSILIVSIMAGIWILMLWMKDDKKEKEMEEENV
jgi:hypothetical protein